MNYAVDTRLASRDARSVMSVVECVICLCVRACAYVCVR